MGLSKIRTNRVALLFSDVTPSAKKPISEAYPKTLKTIGDHLRKRRLDSKLYQKHVAKAIGVDTLTICNLKNNLTTPRLYLMPRICHFLGHNPLQGNPTTLGEKIKQYRIQKGLSLRKLAKILGVDPATLARWERGEPLLSAKVGNQLEKLRLILNDGRVEANQLR
jgi:transcriptional regulator with XRE-family HTH domain